MRISVVGCGNIGFAITQSLLERGLTTPQDLWVVQRGEPRTVFLRERIDCNISQSPSKELAESELLLIAVKPQDFPSAAEQIAPLISSKMLIISVMAGVRISSMQKLLAPATQIIRSMPNLPARIARSVTPYFAPDVVAPENISRAEKVLLSFGSAIRLHAEEEIDAATAISGSGPAYFYLFIESLLEAARKIGLAESEARLMVRDMISGSLDLWTKNLDELSTLRDAPRSKAGTTEAAFKVLFSRNFKESVIEAVVAAHARAQELSECLSSQATKG